MPMLHRPPINTNNNDDYYETLMERQGKAEKNYGAPRNYNSVPVGSTVVVQRKNGGPWTHSTIIDKEDPNHTN